MENYELLEELCAIPGASGDESRVRDFIIRWVNDNKKYWAVKPELFYGDDFQDCLIIQFGEPRLAAFAHMDTIGFTVRYEDQLVAIGSPNPGKECNLVGSDSLGPIYCKGILEKNGRMKYKFGRAIETGTILTYEPAFKKGREYITASYLDNRLGIYNLLRLAPSLQNGLLVFSCWEEHGGGSIPFLVKFMVEKFGVKQGLISDITWITDGIHFGEGAAVSLRDRNLPRKKFLDKVIQALKNDYLPFQLEVEGEGSSDGRELQTSPYPFDWCFIGAPITGAHSPTEKVHIADLESMNLLYQSLFKQL